MVLFWDIGFREINFEILAIWGIVLPEIDFGDFELREIGFGILVCHQKWKLDAYLCTFLVFVVPPL